MQHDVQETLEAWPRLSPEERVVAFRQLPLDRAGEFLMCMNAVDQAHLLLAMPEAERRAWVRYLAPDEVADIVQEAEDEERDALLDLLDHHTANEVRALLAYAEDDAGGLMNPRFARLRPRMTVDQAIRYLRQQTTHHVSMDYVYVLDADQRLLGEVAVDRLLSARPDETMEQIMDPHLITVLEATDQEEVAALFARYGLTAMPVVDEQGRMKGMITADDVVDVLQEEATEDAQRFGGMEALDEPYLRTSIGTLIGARAGWLVVLFLGELLTTTAMAQYEHEIAKAVVLALFIPLIISSGGNSGSQASTLVIRSMAVGEVRPEDWRLVFRREFVSGLALGGLLGLLGLVRVVLPSAWGEGYGEHSVLLGLTVGISLLGVVLVGCMTGAMLPFLLRRLRFDPARASAPFVATLVDVTGLIIYFTTAWVLLRGRLL